MDRGDRRTPVDPAMVPRWVDGDGLFFGVTSRCVD
jgi:hypothetical protein